MGTCSRFRRTALTLFAVGILFASAARADEFKMYQLQVYCTNSQVATVIFGYISPGASMGTKVLCAGHCPGGTVAIKDALAELPAEASKGLQAKVDKHEEDAAAGKGRSLAGCECDNEKIDRLRGRIRGLNEAAGAHRKDFNKKTSERADARDRLWGKGEGLQFEGGSIAEFGKSVRNSLMVAGGTSGVGKIVKETENAQGWVKTAVSIGSSPASLEAWADYGQKVLGKKADEVFTQRSTEALRSAREHFARTGNYVGAQRVYTEKWGSYGKLKDFQKTGESVTTFLGALSALAELAKNTDKVTKDLSDWVNAYQEGDSLQKELDKIDQEIQRVTDEIARLRAACEKGAGASQHLLFARLGSTGSVVAGAIATDADVDDAHFLKVAREAAATNVAIQRAEQALRELALLKTRIRTVDDRLGADIVAPFSPWFGGTWKEAQPRELLIHLAKSAGPGLRRFDNAVKAMTPIAEQANTALQSIPPDTGK